LEFVTCDRDESHDGIVVGPVLFKCVAADGAPDRGEQRIASQWDNPATGALSSSFSLLKETAMKHVSYIVAAGALAVALAGCGDPYYPRYGNSQSYYSPSGYSYYPASYGYSSPASYSYSYPATYNYGSRSDYYRNYNGIHPAPERTFP
jgi:hypothetical protein